MNTKVSTTQFLRELLLLGVRLWVEGGKLRYWAPQGVITPELREELIAHKPEIIQKLDENKTYTLTSYAQQRLWFFDQLTPGNYYYNIPVTVSIKGNLDQLVLIQTLNKIVSRHEALRTTFSALDGVPIQVITKELELKLTTLDLCQSPEEERIELLQKAVLTEVQKPFDLSNGLLIRPVLIHVTEKEYVLLLTMHHIIFDGWSMGVLVHEVGLIYQSMLNGQGFALPELSIQYADFATWQRRWLQGEELEKQLSYWLNKLEGYTAQLDLPADFPRPLVSSFRGGTKSFLIDRGLTDRLREFNLAEGSTLYMTLLAAFKVLLYRYTGQDDIAIGSPIANRNRVDIENLIGFFVNTLVIRTDLSGVPSFRKMIQRVKEVTLGAYAHQDLPFELLVEKLKLERDLSRNTLVQIMFAFQNAPIEMFEIPEMTVEPMEFDNRVLRFDMELHFWEKEHSIQGVLGYSLDLFKSDTIEQLITHYLTVLEGLLTNPEEKITNQPLLSEAERYRLLVEWNATGTMLDDYLTVHQVFESQVELFPDRIAVVFDEERWTYRELNYRANQLAHYLKKFKVGSEVLVAICMERSLEMLVGLLGILKAGGVYVPLDPTYPKERLAFILADTQSQLIITQDKFCSSIPEGEANILALDTEWQVISQESRDNLESIVQSNNLVYVMYTSGSTGQPKGTSILHQGVIRLVKDVNYVSLTSEETLLQFAPLSFDASTFEIWGSLLNGGRCVIFPNYTPSLEELGKFLKKYKITTLWLPAALFNMMIDEQITSLMEVRQLLVGGEALSVSHVRRALEELRDCQIINGYGPTENTTFTCCYPIPNSESISRSVPIGRPIANTQVYILDRDFNPVPIGVPGELYIGGTGLAREYFNRPDLTSERFIPNPFNAQPEKKLYKSGDIVRWTSDGTIEFIGRNDYQVKIRGFRIELEEIETVVLQIPRIKETVVIAREDHPGEKRLVAYVTLQDNREFAVSEARHFLRERLPDYMIPSAFVVITELPLTLNGKVDRQALPKPEHLRPHLENNYVAPQTEIEQAIATVWQRALKIERVGVEDNFFDLGGHSLLLVKVHAELKDIFEQNLSIIDLFKYPTVSALAQFLAEKESKESSIESGYSRAENRLKAIQQQRSRLRYRIKETSEE